MKRMIASGAGSVAALAVAAGLVLPGTAGAQTMAQPRPVPVKHVVECGGRYAADVVRGSTVMADRYRPSQATEDFAVVYQGGTLRLQYAPNGHPRGLYVQVTPSGSRLVPGGQATRLHQGQPQHGCYTLWVEQGRHVSVVTDEHGRIDLTPVGRHGPASNQLWYLTR